MPERKPYNCQAWGGGGGVADEEEPVMVEELSIEVFFGQGCPELDEDEARKVKALIRRTLQYDPVKRPSAAEISRAPWFKDSEIRSSFYQ